MTQLNYEGELDEENKACGIGRWQENRLTYEGMFENDLPMGFGTQVLERAMFGGARYEGEFKYGKLSGKCTAYYPNSHMTNLFYEKGILTSST